MSSSHTSHEEKDPLQLYLTVFFTLLGLLVLTVIVYYIPFEKVHIGSHNLGFMNTVIALLIASTKALMVLTIFMHLNHSKKLIWIVAGAGFIWLAIMVVFTFADYLSRGTMTDGSIAPISQIRTSVPDDSGK